MGTALGPWAQGTWAQAHGTRACGLGSMVTWTCSIRSEKAHLDAVKKGQAAAVARTLLEDDTILFNAFDVDDDCQVSRDELKGILDQLTPESAWGSHPHQHFTVCFLLLITCSLHKWVPYHTPSIC